MPRPALLLLMLLATGEARGAQPPRRIVSTNLCADQYLLALADRRQIAALTMNARDPSMSAAAGRAAGLPTIRGTAEDVLALDPDLILTMTDATGAAFSALAGRRYRTLAVPPANSIAEIEAQIDAVAAAVGHPDRGKALKGALETTLVSLPRPGRGRVAAYYQRRGFLTGRGTLVDELMTRLGLVNLATTLGRPALSQLPLEQIVAARPDVLIVDEETVRASDQGTEMLGHPALAGIPRLTIPGAWTICGGPAYARAAESLARQLKALR
ncbi:ABC transporter substrate-binding protein [Sphingomonas sp. ID0503]|uniref:ABC transporter substrate-binding protein n=1 Tax=Sphingomonas sp. ID0503 TaxID=3399691 RepID=UPI003AFAC300